MSKGQKSPTLPPRANDGANRPRFADSIGQRLDVLAKLTDNPKNLTRLYLGPAHRRAADQVAAWMRQAGMTVRHDSVGSVIGRYEGAASGARTLLLGSHIDTVRNGGRYDGTLGVLAAIAVVEELGRTGTRLPFAIEVTAFGDEEGVRFAGTLTGSRALAGRFERHLLDEIDGDGISRRDALTGFGCDVTRIADEARDPASLIGYVELHIEQGPVLETENLPVAAVTVINGATRGRITVTGGGGHAGTVPMTLRRDALAAAAEMILAVERLATSEPDLVATAGVLDVANPAVNAIPGLVTFSLDLRSPSDSQRRASLARLEATLSDIAKRRGVDVDVTFNYDAPATVSDDRLTDALAAAIERQGFSPRRMPSGAGHDAMAFKDRVPLAMLFVRSRAGISHHPDEYTSADDIEIATRVLADFVTQLSASPAAQA